MADLAEIPNLKPFDFDEVWIVNTEEFKLEEFVVKLVNDEDAIRKGRYRMIPVYIRPEAGLSTKENNLLRKNFTLIHPLTKAMYESVFDREKNVTSQG